MWVPLVKLSVFRVVNAPIPEPKVKDHPFAVAPITHMKKIGIEFNCAKVSLTAIYVPPTTAKIVY
jgi:hypothetical protein